MRDAIQVVTTTSSGEEADRNAQALVSKQLAACVQVSAPVTSSYRWQAKLDDAHEGVRTIKTGRAHYIAVERAICELHSYAVLDIIAFEVVAGSQAYLDWLGAELAQLPGPKIVCPANHAPKSVPVFR